ncbi:hypothetical protein B484DRAFT_403167, partial [Ochromonadaceae sp. CCMP2298]
MILRSDLGVLQLKRLGRDLPIIRRHLAITSHEQVSARKLKSLILTLMVLEKTAPSRRVTVALKIAIVRYLALVVEPPQIDPYDLPTPRKHLMIDDFSHGDSNLFFRFKRGHLHKLCELLKMPEEVMFSNRAKMRGEEIFLRG